MEGKLFRYFTDYVIYYTDNTGIGRSVQLDPKYDIPYKYMILADTVGQKVIFDIYDDGYGHIKHYVIS